MKPSESAKLVAVLASAYPREKITQQTLQAYAEFLEDLDYDACQQAIASLIQLSAFFPTVAEIRREVKLSSDPLGFHAAFGPANDYPKLPAEEIEAELEDIRRRNRDAGRFRPARNFPGERA